MDIITAQAINHQSTKPQQLITIFHQEQNLETKHTRLANVNFALVRLRLSRSILRFASRPLCQIRLVTLPLRVGQVIPLVVVQSQAKLTLIATNPNEKLHDHNDLALKIIND